MNKPTFIRRFCLLLLGLLLVVVGVRYTTVFVANSYFLMVYLVQWTCLIVMAFYMELKHEYWEPEEDAE